jgi:hypothetical protein
MGEPDNFRIQLHRMYPQVAHAAEILVTEYNAILNQLGKLPKGELEIEAFFGKIHYTKGHHRFDNHISGDIMKELMSMLDGFSAWDQVEEWFMVCDYYLPGGERIRVRDTEYGRHVSTVHKHNLGRKDFSYCNATGWELRDYITRVNMKLEEEIKDDAVDIKNFTSVKISVRKCFIAVSKNLPRLKFRFEAIQYWTGATLKEAEDAMMFKEPQLSVECEIVNVPRENTMAEKDKFIMFTSLLMKMQDFMDFPICYEAVNDKHRVNNVGVFTPV